MHPHAHEYEIREYGPALFAFAADRDALVLTHCGDPGSYPEDFVPFADRHADLRLILADLGNSHDGSITRQVDAIKPPGTATSSSTPRRRVRSSRPDRMGGGGDRAKTASCSGPTRRSTGRRAKSPDRSAESARGPKEAILFRNAAALLNEGAAL